MNKVVPRQTFKCGLAGALTLAALIPAAAAPVLSNTAAIKLAPSAQVTEVRWRGAGIAAGIGAGLALGALAASQSGYYGYSPYYGPAYYDYGPTYYGGYYQPYYGSVYSYGYQGYEPYYYYQGRRDTNATNNW